MAMEVGIKAKLQPELDSRQTDKQVDELESKFTEAEQMEPTADTSDLEKQLEDISLDGLGVPDMGGGGQRGGGGGSGAGAAAAGGGLAKFAKGGLLKVTLAGAVGFGLLTGINRIASASPAWQKTQSMFSEAMSLFFRPFGNKMSGWFSPLAEDLLDMAVDFNRIAGDKGLTVAVMSLPGNVADNLSAEGAGIGLGTVLGGAGGALAGAKGGAMLGGAAGSVVPGVGTAIGAGAGAVIGGGIGLAGGGIGGGAIGGRIGEAVGDFEWSDWVDPHNWDSWVTALEWSAWVPGLGWGTFISTIAWDGFVERMDWDERLSPLNWDGYLTDVNWGAWVPGLSWASFLTSVNWRDWLSVNSWGTYLSTLSWTRFVPDISWASFVPDLNWSSFIDGLGGGIPLAQGGIATGPTNALIGEAGPEAVLPLSDLQRALENAARAGATQTSSGDGNATTDKVVRALEEVKREIQRLDTDVSLEMDGEKVARTTRRSNERYHDSRIVRK